MYKFLFEFIPVVIFYVVFKMSDIFAATFYFLISSIISISLLYYIERKISGILILSNIILVVTSSLTLISGDSSYIKMKPTFVSLIFASILIFGLLRKNGMIKYIFGKSIKMSDSAWLKLSFRFAIFFIFLAILNELIWRNFSEKIWVNFKIFGYTGLMLLFTISQLKFIIINSKEKENV